MASYSIDTTHSEVAFTVRHMMFAKVRGQFKTWTASLDFNAQNPSASQVSAEIDTASVDTREAARDTHLRSADFFESEKFPKMTFKSTGVEAAGTGKYKVTGDLTIRGATHPVVLDVEQTGAGKDPWGNDRLGFSAKTTISRSQWGLTWNQALEAGGILVSDKVEIDVEVQVIQGK